jgi:hypothetical protein
MDGLASMGSEQSDFAGLPWHRQNWTPGTGPHPDTPPNPAPNGIPVCVACGQVGAHGGLMCPSLTPRSRS